MQFFPKILSFFNFQFIVSIGPILSIIGFNNHIKYIILFFWEKIFQVPRIDIKSPSLFEEKRFFRIERSFSWSIKNGMHLYFKFPIHNESRKRRSTKDRWQETKSSFCSFPISSMLRFMKNRNRNRITNFSSFFFITPLH